MRNSKAMLFSAMIMALISMQGCLKFETCSDGIQNQTETGVDCGGSCVACITTGTCWDGIQNQGETGIDCGGPSCLPCSTTPTCFDGIQNQGEAGIDCGGPCLACAATCFDGIQNQGETGIDCGGPCVACGTATCFDGIQNQGETGIDCGGPCTACTSACSVTSVTDIDGNNYSVVSIGGQCWMSSNLKTTRYRNGTLIPKVDDGWDWWHVTDGAYCDYDNLAANGTTYGKLYNWHAVNTGILCPAGWHVPTISEWSTLEVTLGNDNSVGGKLKETGTVHWQSPNTGATNSSGFTALPGGNRTSTGSFFNLEWNGYFWSATEGTDIAYGRYRYVDFNLTGFFNNEDYKVDGMSVRCVKD